MQPPQRTTRFPLFSAMLTITAATAGFAALAWLGLPQVGGQWLVEPTVVALAVCGVFGLLALIPVAVLDRRMAGGAAYGFMIGIIVRMAGCAIVYFALKNAGYPEVFVFCMAGAYMLLLMVEIIIIGRYVRQIQPQTTPRVAGPTAEAQG